MFFGESAGTSQVLAECVIGGNDHLEGIYRQILYGSIVQQVSCGTCCQDERESVNSRDARMARLPRRKAYYSRLCWGVNSARNKAHEERVWGICDSVFWDSLRQLPSAPHKSGMVAAPKYLRFGSVPVRPYSNAYVGMGSPQYLKVLG